MEEWDPTMLGPSLHWATRPEAAQRCSHAANCPSGQRCLEGGTEARPGAELGLWSDLLVVRTTAEWTPDRLSKAGMSQEQS